jgi:ABC-2 type transport system permease protein
VLGSASFCALGLAATALVANAESAPAVLNILVFPLLFVSGIFFPLDNAPTWLTTFAKIFPIYHVAAALQDDFNPATAGAGFRWADLAVVALWGAAGAVLAIRYFRWENQRSG